MKERRKFIPLVIFIVILIAGFFVAWKTGFLDFIKNVSAMQDFFNGFGVIGYIIYILLYVLVSVFMLPASIFTIMAGMAFGPVKGAILALTGSTMGACVSFIIARYLARDLIKNKFKDNAIFKKVEEGTRKNGANFLILTRLVPIFPYNVQNYAYGITEIKFSIYALITLICMAPGAFIYAFMAGEIIKNGVSFDLLIKFTIAGVVLFLVSLVPKYLAKRKGIDLDN
ncbi:MAG: TVP38/TMEM64 family protein [Bacilli bacterium]